MEESMNSVIMFRFSVEEGYFHDDWFFSLKDPAFIKKLEQMYAQNICGHQVTMTLTSDLEIEDGMAHFWADAEGDDYKYAEMIFVEAYLVVDGKYRFKLQWDQFTDMENLNDVSI